MRNEPGQVIVQELTREQALAISAAYRQKLARLYAMVLDRTAVAEPTEAELKHAATEMAASEEGVEGLENLHVLLKGPELDDLNQWHLLTLLLGAWHGLCGTALDVSCDVNVRAGASRAWRQRERVVRLHRSVRYMRSLAEASKDEFSPEFEQALQRFGASLEQEGERLANLVTNELW